MPSISISEAQSRLGEIVKLIADSGDSYLLCSNGKPVVELRPFVAKPTSGRFRGQIMFTEDAFEPMS